MAHRLARTPLPLAAHLTATIGLLGSPAVAQNYCAPSDSVLELRQQWPYSNRVSTAALADVDLDGQLDLVAVRDKENSWIYLFLGTMSGAFAEPERENILQHARCITIGDFDGDQIPDGLTGVTPSDRAQLVSNLAEVGPWPFIGVPTADQPLRCDSGDLNGDGARDAVFACRNADSVSVLLGVGDGTFATALNLQVGNNPRDLRLAYLDADQHLDLVVVHYQNGAEDVIVYLGDGTGSFTAQPGYETGAGGAAVEIGDLDADGALDIVVVNSVSNTASALLGNGDGSFNPPVHTSTGTEPTSLLIDDLSGDGMLDVLVGNYGDASLGMLENDGAGVLLPQVELPLIAFPHELHSADLDGDGQPELVVLSDADSPDPFGYIQTFSFNWTGDDSFAPNHDCSSAALLTAGSYEDLVLVDDHPSDVFAVDVPAGWRVAAEVERGTSLGRIETYLYDQSSLGQECGTGSGYADADVSDSSTQTVEEMNQGMITKTYFVQVHQAESPAGNACNGYRIRILLELPEEVRSLCSGAEPYTDCPCGNQSSHPLDGCANATGQGARISLTGSLSVQADDAVLHLTRARPGQPALLIQGWTETRQPFRDGVLCAGNPTRRLESLVLDLSGAGHTVQSIVQTGTIPGPGSKRIYQFWYRDPLISPCGTGSNFSAAAELTWQ